MADSLSRAINSDHRKRVTIVLLLLTFLLLSLAFLSVFFGPASNLHNSWQSIFSSIDSPITSLILKIRLPRVLLGVIAGGGLALCGAALQILFHNPLADSALIGINSGAMLGAILGILFGKVFVPLRMLTENFPNFVLPFLAFIGALALGHLVYKISSRGRVISVAKMILAGVAANAFAGAFAGLLIISANEEQLRTITFWSMGSLNGGTWSLIFPLGIYVSLGSFLVMKEHRKLDAMALGEREAIYLGVDTEKVKRKILLLTALICGPIVSFVGLISFVGLVVPHIIRITLGPKSSVLFPCSFLLGGIFLTGADFLAKNLAPPMELPIGVLTALIGAPFFTFLLLKEFKE